jgi:hypothetical protein
MYNVILIASLLTLTFHKNCTPTQQFSVEIIKKKKKKKKKNQKKIQLFLILASFFLNIRHLKRKSNLPIYPPIYFRLQKTGIF